MECDFQVGDKVVCVNDEWLAPMACPLRKGAVYTVSRIDPYVPSGRLPDGSYGTTIGVSLQEVRHPDFFYTGLDWFCVTRFRKVQKKRDADYAAFKAKLLDGLPMRQPERVQ